MTCRMDTWKCPQARTVWPQCGLRHCADAGVPPDRSYEPLSRRKGRQAGRVFRPHVSDILKFARRGDGSRQVEEVEAALDRLRGTTIKTVRENGKFRTTEAEGLIARYRVLSRTDTKRISSVEIEAPEWIYREVVDGKRPEVLTVHSDYFLIEPGIGRYLYRLARRAAGRTEAKWSLPRFTSAVVRRGRSRSSPRTCERSSPRMTCPSTH